MKLQKYFLLLFAVVCCQSILIATPEGDQKQKDPQRWAPDHSENTRTSNINIGARRNFNKQPKSQRNQNIQLGTHRNSGITPKKSSGGVKATAKDVALDYVTDVTTDTIWLTYQEDGDIGKAFEHQINEKKEQVLNVHKDYRTWHYVSSPGIASGGAQGMFVDAMIYLKVPPEKLFTDPQLVFQKAFTKEGMIALTVTGPLRKMNDQFNVTGNAALVEQLVYEVKDAAVATYHATGDIITGNFSSTDEALQAYVRILPTALRIAGVIIGTVGGQYGGIIALAAEIFAVLIDIAITEAGWEDPDPDEAIINPDSVDNALIAPSWDDETENEEFDSGVDNVDVDHVKVSTGTKK